MLTIAIHHAWQSLVILRNARNASLNLHDSTEYSKYIIHVMHHPSWVGFGFGFGDALARLEHQVQIQN